jgi:ABC-type iron transport system FetAB permease component
MGGGCAAWCGWSHWRPNAGDSIHLLLSMVPSNKLFMMSFISYNFSYPLQTFFLVLIVGKEASGTPYYVVPIFCFYIKQCMNVKDPLTPFP